MNLVPITIPVPTVLGAPVVRAYAYSQLQVVSAAANLRALTTGPFTIQIRQAGNGAPLIKEFTFDAAGPQATPANELAFFVEPELGIRVDVTAVGTGAQDCLVTLWCLVQ